MKIAFFALSFLFFSTQSSHAGPSLEDQYEDFILNTFHQYAKLSDHFARCQEENSLIRAFTYACTVEIKNFNLGQVKSDIALAKNLLAQYHQQASLKHFYSLTLVLANLKLLLSTANDIQIKQIYTPEAGKTLDELSENVVAATDTQDP